MCEQNSKWIQNPNGTATQKGTMFCKSQQTVAVSNKHKYSLLLCKKPSFLSKNFRVLCKYKVMGAMETRVLAKTVRLQKKIVYRAQRVPFVSNINYLGGTFAQISASVRARVIEFFLIGISEVQGSPRRCRSQATSQQCVAIFRLISAISG